MTIYLKSQEECTDIETKANEVLKNIYNNGEALDASTHTHILSYSKINAVKAINFIDKHPEAVDLFRTSDFRNLVLLDGFNIDKLLELNGSQLASVLDSKHNRTALKEYFSDESFSNTSFFKALDFLDL